MHPPNYLELCSNYVAGSVFFSKKWSSVSQDWPCFEGPASAIRKGEWEVARYQKKSWFAQCRAKAFHPDTWEATTGYVEQTRIGEVGCGSRQIEGQAWPDWRTVGDIAHC